MGKSMPRELIANRPLKKKGRKSAAEKEIEAAAMHAMGKHKPRTDAEIRKEQGDAFQLMELIAKGVAEGTTRSAVFNGGPGIGKSYTVEAVVKKYARRSLFISGGLSAVELYVAAYFYRRKGDVLVVDDSDGVFGDEEALNVLKVLTDSKLVREPNWRKDSGSLKNAEGPDGHVEDVPKSFIYEGSIIFISNLNFQAILDTSYSRIRPHIEALMSRAIHLDLRLHTRQECYIRVEYVATEGKIFAREGVSEATGKKIMAFIKQHRDELKELSIRTVLKACELSNNKSIPANMWETAMTQVLCRR